MKFNLLAVMNVFSLVGAVANLCFHNVQMACVFVFLSLIITSVALEIRTLREELKKLRDKA
jgi:ABC-type multidrug transport system fused ATPase/permease subunit